MTDLDAIIQAAEETLTEVSKTLPAWDFGISSAEQAAKLDHAAFSTFIAKLKALRQGIYG